jgi:hypothetical protein
VKSPPGRFEMASLPRKDRETRPDSAGCRKPACSETALPYTQTVTRRTHAVAMRRGARKCSDAISLVKEDPRPSVPDGSAIHSRDPALDLNMVG